MRPRSRASMEEIENEIRAMTKFCVTDRNENIIRAFRTGKLSPAPYHFIDMEYCDFTLDTYISNQWINNVKKMYRPRQYFSIVRDILKGVAFLHGKSEAHRDLKPRNGKH